MQTDNPINTASIEQFIQIVKSADASRAKEVKLDIQKAKALAFTLGIVMSRLHSNVEDYISKQDDNAVIQVNMDGGNSW